MADFTLDTSGSVHGVGFPTGGNRSYFWSDLSPFEQGYGGAAARELYLKLLARGWEPEDALAAVAFRNWSPETLAAIRKDCAAISALIPGLDAGDGKDIWMARQKGFPGSGTVTEYMRAHFPPLTVSLNDAGKVTTCPK